MGVKKQNYTGSSEPGESQQGLLVYLKGSEEPLKAQYCMTTGFVCSSWKLSGNRAMLQMLHLSELHPALWGFKLKSIQMHLNFHKGSISEYMSTEVWNGFWSPLGCLAGQVEV